MLFSTSFLAYMSTTFSCFLICLYMSGWRGFIRVQCIHVYMYIYLYMYIACTCSIVAELYGNLLKLQRIVICVLNNQLAYHINTTLFLILVTSKKFIHVNVHHVHHLHVFQTFTCTSRTHTTYMYMYTCVN